MAVESRSFSYEAYSFALKDTVRIRARGQVVQLIGLVIEAVLQGVRVGELCYIYSIDRSRVFPAEVMGFKETDRNEHGMVFFRCGADHHAIGLKPMGKGKKPQREMKTGLQMEHLAFEVDNVDVLLKAKEYFKKNNIPIVFEGRKGAGCNISINFLDPDGFEFEIYCEMDQIGPDGRLRPESISAWRATAPRSCCSTSGFSGTCRSWFCRSRNARCSDTHRARQRRCRSGR